MVKQNNHLICLFCLDDITAGVHRQRDRESPGGIASIPDFMTLGRQLGLGVILVVHSISAISDLIRQNVGTFYICGLQGENPWIIRDTLGITPGQQESFRSSRPGELICVNPVCFDKPVYATFDQLDIPGECDEAMRQADLAPFFKMLHTTRPAPLDVFLPDLPEASSLDNASRESPLPGPPGRGMEFMVQAGTGLPAPIMSYYDRMAINATQGRRITRRLEELGFIKIHAFSTGKRGGRISLVEVTEPGWKLLEKNGVCRPKARTNGDWEHEAAAQLIEAAGKKQGCAVSFEVEIGGMRLDVQWLDRKSGQRHSFNIGISRPAHEVESIEKFFQLPASHNNAFTLVARDTDFAKKVKDILNQKDPQGRLLSQINIKLVTDLIPI